MNSNLKSVLYCFLVDCATVSKGFFGFCFCNTCSLNDGDCNFHTECPDGIFCGLNNCPDYLGFDPDIDCCTDEIPGILKMYIDVGWCMVCTVVIELYFSYRFATRMQNL